MTKIVKGWVFFSADFSMLASGSGATGRVLLVRDLNEKRRWMLMSDAIKNDDDCPELYVWGDGETLEEAIKAANGNAKHARPIP